MNIIQNKIKSNYFKLFMFLSKLKKHKADSFTKVLL